MEAYYCFISISPRNLNLEQSRSYCTQQEPIFTSILEQSRLNQSFSQLWPCKTERCVQENGHEPPGKSHPTVYIRRESHACVQHSHPRNISRVNVLRPLQCGHVVIRFPAKLIQSARRMSWDENHFVMCTMRTWHSYVGMNEKLGEGKPMS